MQFLPGDLAQLQVDDEANRRRQAQAQALQQAGFNPVQGGNPLLAMLSSVMSTVQGGRMMNEADAKASEIMAKRFEIENQQAQAKAEQERARRLEDRQWGLEDKETEAQIAARYAQRNIDPLSPEGIAAALGLEKGKKALSPPSVAKQSLEEQMWGMLTPEQRQAAAQAKWTGGGKPERGAIPAGMQMNAQGVLERMPGLPEQPAEIDPRKELAGDALRYVSAITGKSLESLKGATPEQVAALVESSSPALSGPILGNLPYAGVNTDAILKKMAANQARINNPKGVVTGPDFDAAEASLPRMDRPASVNAELIRNMLSGVQMGGQGGQTQPAPQGAPAPGTVQAGYRFKGGNPADPNSWEPAG